MQPDALSEAIFVPDELPRRGTLALWGEAVDGADATVELALPSGRGVRRRRVPARLVPLAEALPLLTAVRPNDASASMSAWSAAATAGLGLVARGRLLPTITAQGYDAWRVGPLDPADTALLHALADSFCATAHALPVAGSRPLRIRSPEALIRLLWDALADSLVRTAAAASTVSHPAFAAAEPTSVEGLRDWLTESDRGVDAGARAGLRLVLPDDGDEKFQAILQLRSASDPSLVVDVADLWHAPLAVLNRLGPSAESDLLLALRRGAQAWPPLSAALREAAPSVLDLDEDAVDDLLGSGAEVLGGAGIEVLWPAELLTGGLTIRATARATPQPGAVTTAGLDLDALLDFRWQVSLDGEALTSEEIAALADAKRPLVRMRGRWISVDPAMIERLRRRARRTLRGTDALAAALTGTLDVDGEAVEFVAPDALAELAGRLAQIGTATAELPEPDDLAATLRPYQRRGLAWLAQMCDLGLGACLADDMGLGKTIQLIGLHLHRRGDGSGPTLVVCPTSLLGNWEREIRRFAPGVPVRRFHGGERHLTDVAADEIVLTTYGVIRRDRPALAEIDWGLVVADEAQHAKNPLSRTARELRALPSATRIALTGTPVENRLSELWSVLDWTTPGLLGPLETFRHRFAVPVERYRDPGATERLTRLVRPFLLRRRKSDPGIAPELPPKTETDRIVPLTGEQATLYEAVVRETMAQIQSSEGIERRGLVLKLITALKQVCNHPAQYLKQIDPLRGRSGKLDALDELVDVITAEGESVLVFSQYVGMASLLERHLSHRGVATLFLHGSVPVAQREELVRRFQDGGAPVFLLSLKAGGVGLNLTNATHVVHYDRWWNPAVEDQATDRAYRIGQDRPVQVHRLVTEGTLEDRIAALLESKRELAESVVGSGEAWLTELDDADLADLVALREPA